jgi:Fe-S-cluster containining protein
MPTDRLDPDNGCGQCADSPENLPSALWWGNGLRFSCIGCGRCCRGEPGAIFITPAEESAISCYLGISTEDFGKRFKTSRWKAPSLKEKKNGECIFYQAENARCSVYPVRPLQCRLFPFWPVLLSSEEEWEKAAEDCPGMNSGRLYSVPEIAELLAQCPFPSLL